MIRAQRIEDGNQTTKLEKIIVWLWQLGRMCGKSSFELMESFRYRLPYVSASSLANGICDEVLMDATIPKRTSFIYR